MIFPLLLSACGTAGSTTSVEVPDLPAKQWIEGTIVQPWTMDGYLTPERWAREFEYMRAVGIDTYILQWTADSSAKTTIFPTTIFGWEQVSPLDQVGMALSNAKRYDMKVYLGLAFDQEWFSKQASDRAWLLDQAAAMNLVADDLYRGYFDRYPDNFGGWYLNWEMDNVSGYNTRISDRQTMIEALAKVVDQLHGLNPNLPTAIAPYFNTRMGAKPNAWGEFWEEIIPESGIDILMLQDGVGVGHASVKELPPWFEAVCRAAHQKGIQCWDDLEIFSGASAVNSPAPTRRIIQQIQAVAPFVDKIVSFSFNVAMSPEFGLDPVYYQSYKSYVDSQTALTNP